VSESSVFKLRLKVLNSSAERQLCDSEFQSRLTGHCRIFRFVLDKAKKATLFDFANTCAVHLWVTVALYTGWQWRQSVFNSYHRHAGGIPCCNDVTLLFSRSFSLVLWNLWNSLLTLYGNIVRWSCSSNATVSTKNDNNVVNLVRYACKLLCME